MIAIFVAICASIYFFLEAKKRGQSSVKWSLMAIFGFLVPQVVVSVFIVPIIVGFMGKPIDDALVIIILGDIIALVLGFLVLSGVRKNLFKHQRLIPDEGAI